MIHKSFNCNLNQLTSFSRGVLSDANSDGLFDTVASPSRTQAWNLDALGNWSTFTTNSTSQSRSHNAQDQLTAVGSTTLSYDANGSMTADESGRIFVYDAWNRLAAVRNTANSPIVGYSYDALGRRIIEDRPNANTVDHLYYSTAWQVLEERRDGTSSGDVRRQYLWSIDYVDALTARVDYASGAVSATYHAQYDANWNVTAIADASAGVLERYAYDPYGVATVLYANWSVRGGSPYGWNYLHQGGRFDVDANLYHFRHRDYSATLGRWTQTDPIGFDAGDFNLYRYLGNEPVKGLDPSGLEEESTQGSGLWAWNWFDDTIDDAKTIINAGATVDDNFNRNAGYRWDPFDPNAPIVTHAGIIYPGGKPLTKDTAKLCQTVAEYGAAAGGMYGPGFGKKGIPQPRIKPINLPSYKRIGIDWDEILSGHVIGGRRLNPGNKKTVFPEAWSKKEIERAIIGAYKSCKKVSSQGDHKVKVRGKSRGLTIEMWINVTDGMIETAYPSYR